MLVLTRKVDQSVVIDGSIVVTVVRINASSVRLGITTADGVVVLRNELLEEQASDLCI